MGGGAAPAQEPSRAKHEGAAAYRDDTPRAKRSASERVEAGFVWHRRRCRARHEQGVAPPGLRERSLDADAYTLTRGHIAAIPGADHRLVPGSQIGRGAEDLEGAGEVEEHQVRRDEYYDPPRRLPLSLPHSGIVEQSGPSDKDRVQSDLDMPISGVTSSDPIPRDAAAYWASVRHVPELKTIKNGLHVDIRTDDRDAEVDRLLVLGATRVDVGKGDESWVVFADPEALPQAWDRVVALLDRYLASLPHRVTDTDRFLNEFGR